MDLKLSTSKRWKKIKILYNGWQTCEGKDLEVQIFNLKQM